MICVTLILLALLAACVMAVVIQTKRARAYKADVERLSGIQEEINRMIERGGALEAKKKKLEEEADELRKALNDAGDGDLVRRANALFGGVPDASKQSGS
jgi:septal ring factor EnvC (AmiA/AmiB activator)